MCPLCCCSQLLWPTEERLFPRDSPLLIYPPHCHSIPRNPPFNVSIPYGSDTPVLFKFNLTPSTLFSVQIFLSLILCYISLFWYKNIEIYVLYINVCVCVCVCWYVFILCFNIFFGNANIIFHCGLDQSLQFI